MNVVSAALAVGGVLVALGAAIAFADARPVPRVRGLALMALGAVVTLAAARPAAATTWWMVLAAALTLSAMVTAAALLVRRLRRVAPDADLDDEPA